MFFARGRRNRRVQLATASPSPAARGRTSGGVVATIHGSSRERHSGQTYILPLRGRSEPATGLSFRECPSALTPERSQGHAKYFLDPTRASAQAWGEAKSGLAQASDRAGFVDGSDAAKAVDPAGQATHVGQATRLPFITATAIILCAGARGLYFSRQAGNIPRTNFVTVIKDDRAAMGLRPADSRGVSRSTS